MKTIKNILLSLTLACGLLQFTEQKAITPQIVLMSMRDRVIEKCLRAIPVVGPIVGTCLVHSTTVSDNKLGYMTLAATGALDCWAVKNVVPTKGAASVLFGLMLAGPATSDYLLQSQSVPTKALGYVVGAATSLVDLGYILEVVLS